MKQFKNPKQKPIIEIIKYNQKIMKLPVRKSKQQHFSVAIFNRYFKNFQFRTKISSIKLENRIVKISSIQNAISQ